MQHVRRALVVRHVVGLDVDALGLEQRLQRLRALAVGAVAEADRGGRVVEPEAVAAVGVGVAVELAEHGDVEALELASAAWPGSRMRAGLAMLSGMPPRAAEDQRVVHVAGVDLALERLRDLDLDAEAVEQLDERRVLALERRPRRACASPRRPSRRVVAGVGRGRAAAARPWT